MCFDFGQFGAMPKTSPIKTIRAAPFGLKPSKRMKEHVYNSWNIGDDVF